MNYEHVALTFDTDSYSANRYPLTFDTHLSNCFISHLRLSVRVQSVRAFTMAHFRLAIVNAHTDLQVIIYLLLTWPILITAFFTEMVIPLELILPW